MNRLGVFNSVETDTVVEKNHLFSLLPQVMLRGSRGALVKVTDSLYFCPETDAFLSDCCGHGPVLRRRG